MLNFIAEVSLRSALMGMMAHIMASLRALLFLRVPREMPEISFGVAAAMIALAIASGAAVERAVAGADAELDVLGLNAAIAGWAVFAVLLVMLRRAQRPLDLTSLVATSAGISMWSAPMMLAAVSAPMQGLVPSGYSMEWLIAASMVPLGAAMIWLLIGYWRLGRAVTTDMPHRLGLALPAMVMLSVVLLPSRPIFSGDGRGMALPSIWDAYTFWQVSQRSNLPREQPRPSIDVEAAWDRQPMLVAEALAGLAPSRPGLPEVYFVGAAAYAGQDVFKREVGSTREIMDERLGTRGRSLLLVNHRDTVETLPLANATNLEKVLTGLGRIMDREKDVLVLYVTSHGNKGQLSVSISRFGFNDLTPERLAGMLENSGLKNRVVILSACHSGSFLPALEDAGTLAMSAAYAEKTSFGCSNERDWTYFGDALFNHALRQTTSFVEAFRHAAATVAQWEAREKLTPSEPQVYVGARIEAVLAAVEQRLAVEAGGTQIKQAGAH
jgi:hypothetical protein